MSPVLLSAVVVSLAACSGSDQPTPGAASGSGGAAGTATTAGATTGGSAVAGSSTTGGTGVGLAGSSGSTTGGSSGTGGSGGSATGGSALGGNAGAGGADGAAGAGGASGAAGSGSGGFGGAGSTNFWGPGGPKKQWSCPAGPFPAQSMGQAKDACPGFQYNYDYNEGPTWIASQHAFFFSNFIHSSNLGGDIIKYTPAANTCEVWVHEVGCNGLGVSPSGNLLAACHGPRAVMEYDVVTKQGRVIADMAGGKMLDAPNDLIARSDGNVYFSNTTFELGPRPQGLGQALVRIDPLGITSVIQMGGLNGVALSPDENKLYVVGMGAWMLDAAGVPGQKAGGSPGVDGIAVDCAGDVTVNGTNSAYGGDDGKQLLWVGGGTAAKTAMMTVPGLP